MSAMNDKRSDTQYGFKVDLNRPGSMLQEVALLGHQTLSELHEAISASSKDGTDSTFSFSFRNAQVDKNTRLDELNLRVGETLEYVVDSANGKGHQVIAVDFVDDE